MGFNEIAFYLEKFKKITPPDETIKKDIIYCIYEAVGVEIDKKDIEINKKAVFIKADPIIKNEILLKKNKILEELNVRCKEKTYILR